MKRLLIIGCGDIALRAIPLLARRYWIYALVHNPARRELLRKLGVTPVIGDLDDRTSLARIAGLAEVVLHFAPPPGSGLRDMRTVHLLAALSQGSMPQQLVYLSTSGVYGDCAGAWVSEARPLHPQTERAQRRVDAEQRIRSWAARNKVKACILRVPGIYAADRLPLERIRQGVPAIVADEDGYSNHIHADDLARIVAAALRHAQPNRLYHACDDRPIKPGDFLDLVADAHSLPLVPRISRAVAQQELSPVLWTFLNESRRLHNRRLKRELRVHLRYSEVGDGLTEQSPQG